jgi:hypothetical protein
LEVKISAANFGPDQLGAMQKKIHSSVSQDVRASIEQMLQQKEAENGSIASELQRISQELAERPSERDINNMLVDIEASLSQQFGSSRTLQLIMDNLKIDLRRKVTRSEVMSLVAQSVESARAGFQPPDDQLMIGKIPVRCLGCNQTMNKMHNSKATKVLHMNLSPVSATVSPNGNSIRRSNTQPYLLEDGVVVGTFTRGRQGALRPLQRAYTPLKPRSPGRPQTAC